MSVDTLLMHAERLYETHKTPTIITTGSLIRATGMHPQQLVDALKQRYVARQTEIKNEYNLEPPLIALLREEVVGGMPFLKEREKWKNFKPSDGDWARYLRLPLEVTPDIAELLGIYRSAFTIVESGNHYALEQQPSPRDEKFFRSYVVPRISRLHNLSIDYEDRLRISSQAIVRWLTEDIGFPSLSYFTMLQANVQIQFLEGLLAGCGRRQGSNGLRIEQAENDIGYILQLAELAKSLGFNPSIPANQGYMYIPLADLRKISLINPRHQK